MKVLLLLSLLIVATFSVTTSEFLTCADKIDRSNCDADCLKDLDKCNDENGDVQKSDDCKDFTKESEKAADLNKEWNEEMGEYFHGCA